MDARRLSAPRAKRARQRRAAIAADDVSDAFDVWGERAPFGFDGGGDNAACQYVPGGFSFSDHGVYCLRAAAAAAFSCSRAPARMPGSA